jgi:hypothetical protein
VVQDEDEEEEEEDDEEGKGKKGARVMETEKNPFDD